MHAHSRLMCINAGVDDAAQWCVAEVVSKAQIPLFKHVKVKYNCSVMHLRNSLQALFSLQDTQLVVEAERTLQEVNFGRVRDYFWSLKDRRGNCPPGYYCFPPLSLWLYQQACGYRLYVFRHVVIMDLSR